MPKNDFASAPQVKWGLQILNNALKEFEKQSFAEIKFSFSETELPNRFNEQGYQVEIENNQLHVGASNPNGILYALLDIAERIQNAEELPSQWQEAPCLKYRGYTLGLQKQTSHYPDHKYYDWPITPENFPWFYDKAHLGHLLDTLALQRCNLFVLWSAHPFASLLKLNEYPEMLEVDENILLENQNQFNWLSAEAEKRGIQLFLHFYNIHMPDPLAKAKGWNPLSGVPNEEISNYTKRVLSAFVRSYPEIGLITCLGEVLKKSEQQRWLEEVIIPGILDGIQENRGYPPLVIREHAFDLFKYLKGSKDVYPKLMTMMKHNSENLISHRPAPENIELSAISNCHWINVHLCSNLEPFSWGSPRFIQETVDQMVRQNASGVLVFPLRFWDWPNTSHVNPAGDQLYEHFIWWNAWGRYAWNTCRDELEEEMYWQKALCQHYNIPGEAAKALLSTLQGTGDVLPEIASQFMVSSGNRQNLNLGQFIVPLAFTRLQYKGGSGYSMSQLSGFPLIGERLWSFSPVERMQIQSKKSREMLKILKPLVHTSEFLKLIYAEIEVLILLTEYYEAKAKACAAYFQILYGMRGVHEAEAFELLEKSLNLYVKLTEKTQPLFKDAGSLHVYRTIPLPAEKGYLHWKDCLAVFEDELNTAQIGGIYALLKSYTSAHM
jgi:hypothetical protein